MAGSIFKKLRGLLAKFWAKLQLFLKRDGLRVDIKKDGGFFNKNPGRNGIFAYGPSDLDLTIRTRPVLDLILRVRDGSGGQGFTWAPAAAGLAGTEVSVAALHWSRPISAFPGSNRPALGSERLYTAREIHW